MEQEWESGRELALLEIKTFRFVSPGLESDNREAQQEAPSPRVEFWGWWSLVRRRPWGLNGSLKLLAVTAVAREGLESQGRLSNEPMPQLSMFIPF
jgi:hypothetical protein